MADGDMEASPPTIEEGEDTSGNDDNKEEEGEDTDIDDDGNDGVMLGVVIIMVGVAVVEVVEVAVMLSIIRVPP